MTIIAVEVDVRAFRRHESLAGQLEWLRRCCTFSSSPCREKSGKRRRSRHSGQKTDPQAGIRPHMSPLCIARSYPRTATSINRT